MEKTTKAVQKRLNKINKQQGGPQERGGSGKAKKRSPEREANAEHPVYDFMMDEARPEDLMDTLPEEGWGSALGHD